MICSALNRFLAISDLLIIGASLNFQTGLVLSGQVIISPDDDFVLFDNNVLGHVFSETNGIGLQSLVKNLSEKRILRAYRPLNILMTPFGLLEILGISIGSVPDDWDAFVAERLLEVEKDGADEVSVWQSIFDRADEVSLKLLGDFCNIESWKTRYLEKIQYIPQRFQDDFKTVVEPNLNHSNLINAVKFCIKMEMILGSEIPRRLKDIRQKFEINCLSFIFTDEFSQPIFRTIKSIFEYLYPSRVKAAKEDVTLEAGLALQSENKAMSHKRIRDLLDSEIIHLASTGKVQDSDRNYVKIVTMDPPEKLKIKISNYMATIRHVLEAMGDVEGFDMELANKFVPGRIVFLDRNYNVVDDWRVPFPRVASKVHIF